MRSKRYPVKRTSDLVVQDADKEVLIYDLGNRKAFCLNETSALIYDMCDGDLSVSQIAEKLSVKLKQPVSDDLVWLAIDQLSKDDLLEKDSDTVTRFDGLSRRDVIKTIGLASVIALPLVSSIIAPQSIHAASGCVPTSCACSQPAIVASCIPAPGVCGTGCSCVIPTPANCTPDGFGGFDCAGSCG